MKLLTIFLLSLFLLISCTSKNEYGRCIGVSRMHEDKRLDYDLSKRNIILGIIFFELVIPPVYVIVDQTYCPIGRKENGTRN